MSPEPAWKRFERAIARSLGVERTPLSGSSSRITASDTLHPRLFVECKYRTDMFIARAFRLTRARAKEERKIPVMALKARGSPGGLAVLDWDYFLELYMLAEFARKYHEETKVG